MQSNHFLLLKNFKNTSSAQLCLGVHAEQAGKAAPDPPAESATGKLIAWAELGTWGIFEGFQ